MTGAVSVDCPAKVNLFLRILAREDSGHHQIETFFLAVGLYDRVTVAPGRRGIELRIEEGPTSFEAVGAAASAMSSAVPSSVPSAVSSGRESRDGSPPGFAAALAVPSGALGPPEDNTAYRAAQAFYAASGLAPSTVVSLAKGIPPGTGLGGASSDAAGTLAALNLLHGEPLSRAEVLAVGGSVGADVPFFCSGAPAAVAWGRGDRLLPRDLPGPAWVAIAVPRRRMPTADAYASVSAKLALPAGPVVLPRALANSWEALARIRCNDFEEDAFQRIPVLRGACAVLAGEGAVLAGLTGSGSAVFGVFEVRDAAVRAAGLAGALDGIDAAVAVPALERAGLSDSGTSDGT